MQPQMMMGPAPGTTRNTRRAVSLLLVIGVHVGLLYGINAGIGGIIKDRVLGNIQTVEVMTPDEEEDRPPPPPPKLDTAPPPFVPPPDISIEAPVTESTTAIQVTTAVRPVEPPPVAAPRQKVTVQPKADTRRGGNTLPEYPPSEKRAEHTGTVLLQILVLESGRAGDVRVQTSSGYPKLDEAAVGEAKRNWRFIPGTEDGKPVQMWVSVPVVFKLQ